jgi:hypothetical protein
VFSFVFQEVVQSAEIMLNETNVTNSNPPSPLMRTCKKKKKKAYISTLTLGFSMMYKWLQLVVIG